MMNRAAPLLLALTLAAPACDPSREDTDEPDADTDTDADTYPLEVVGDWTDGQGSNHYVTEDTWRQVWYHYTSLHEIVAWSNSDELLVAHNNLDNAAYADLWSRFEWRWDGAALWICQSVMDAATQNDVAGYPRADGDDPGAAGCLGHPLGHFTPLER